MGAAGALALLERLKRLEDARAPWVPVWRELADAFMPRKGGATPGTAGDEDIFDSTPRHALELLASALGGLLTNPALSWFELREARRSGTIGNDHHGSRSLREYRAAARERMLAAFNTEDTGFQTHVHELYLDIALFGTAAMYVEADPDSAVRFTSVPVTEICAAENGRGVVDTVFRRFRMTARQAWNEWGEACSKKLRETLEKSPEMPVEIVHAVFPRTDRDPSGLGARDFPFACVYLEAGEKHVLEESGYLEMPYLVPRWSKAAGETYGRGPGLTALSDVRVLNAMSRTALLAAEKMSDPPLMVPDDGFLGPVRTGPGGLSYYRAGSRDRIEALPIRIDLGSTEHMMETRRKAVRDIFLTARLAEADPAHMTATQSVILQQERLRLLGPMLGRMQTEFLAPLIRRVHGILLRAGELPALLASGAWTPPDCARSTPRPCPAPRSRRRPTPGGRPSPSWPR